MFILNAAEGHIWPVGH